MKLDPKNQELLAIVEGRLSCSAHHLDHVLRVVGLCIDIAKSEKDVDLGVLVPAALLHDIARVEESRDHSGQTDHAVLGAAMSDEILKALGYDYDHIQKIKHCIVTHRFRTGHMPKTIEAKILYDADKLDIIGATGIARTFMIAGQHGQRLGACERMASPLEEVAYLEKDRPSDGQSFLMGMTDLSENAVENGRLKDVSKHSPFMEYEIKFKKIPDRLHTAKARRIGMERLKFMETYFDRLSQEIQGGVYEGRVSEDRASENRAFVS